MKVYEVLNYFDRSRYFVSAASEEEMLYLVDPEYLKKLNDPFYRGDDGQYDDLRNSREERMKDIKFKKLIDDSSKPSISEHNLDGDLDKFYF